MISMTKLHDYLNWAFAFIIALSIVTLVSNVVIYFKLNDTVVNTSQFVQNSIDDARQNIREDIQTINIKSTWSVTTNDINIQLIHYIAEAEVCTWWYSSYKVKVDFYGINPRIENNRLLIIDKRMFSSYDAYNVYLPISDKNTDLDADLCSIKILSSSNK